MKTTKKDWIYRVILLILLAIMQNFRHNILMLGITQWR